MRPCLDCGRPLADHPNPKCWMNETTATLDAYGMTRDELHEDADAWHDADGEDDE